MQSVSQFVRHLDQPRGGYLKKHHEYQISDSALDEEIISVNDETLKPQIIDKIVSYLSKYLFFDDHPAQEILQPVFLGAKKYYQDTKETDVLDAIEKIKLESREINLDLIDDFVIAACLGNYYQKPCDYTVYMLNNLPQLSDNDYKHILVMVERCLNFLRIVKKHSDFLLAGYAIASDPKYRLFDSGDLRTDNAIIDFKFYSKDPWNRYNSAKLAVDYLLGRYGIDTSGEEWQDVDTLVIFDVRHNKVKYVNVEEYKNEIQQIMQSIQKQIQVQLMTNTVM